MDIRVKSCDTLLEVILFRKRIADSLRLVIACESYHMGGMQEGTGFFSSFLHSWDLATPSSLAYTPNAVPDPPVMWLFKSQIGLARMF